MWCAEMRREARGVRVSLDITFQVYGVLEDW